MSDARFLFPQPDPDMCTHKTTPNSATRSASAIRVANRLILMTLVAGSSTGCMAMAAGAVAGVSAGAVSSREIGVRPGAAALVRFARPRDVTLIAAAPRDSAQLIDVTHMYGRIHFMAGDTLWVTLSEVHTSRDKLLYPRSPSRIARIVRDTDARVEPLGDTVSFAVTGAVFGAAAVVGTLWLYCWLQPCFN